MAISNPFLFSLLLATGLSLWLNLPAIQRGDPNLGLGLAVAWLVTFSGGLVSAKWSRLLFGERSCLVAVIAVAMALILYAIVIIALLQPIISQAYPQII